MKQALVSVLMVMLLVLTPVAFISFIPNEPAEAGIGIPLPTVTVRVPGVTVTLPGDPITVRLPGETTTVRVPGPTATVTETQTINGSESTVTITPEPLPAETVTVRPNAGPVPTVTETTTVTPAPRQGEDEPATIELTPEDDAVVKIPETNLGPAEAAGVGTLAILIVAGLILLGMYAGYYMGYKDSDKAEAQFYRSLLGKK